MTPLQLTAACVVCVAILGLLAWLLGSVDLGTPPPDDDEPDLDAILGDAMERAGRRKDD